MAKFGHEFGEPPLADAAGSDLGVEIAFALSRLAEVKDGATPIGIFRAAPREAPAAGLAAELLAAAASFGTEGLERVLNAGDTWSVSG